MSVGLLRRNGNIGMMVTAIQNPSTYATLPQAMSYEYDQLNRLTSAKAYTNLNVGTNTWQNGSTYNNSYLNQFTYDANGNILTQTRYNQAGTQIENLSYKYERDANGRLLRNRLYHVNETVSAGAFADDIDDQGAFSTTNINTSNNYGYDEEGRLIRDDQEDIQEIKWTVGSKVKEVIRTNGSPKKNLKFDYDAFGNRIAKHVYTSANVWEFSEYIVRNPQGKALAVYEKCSANSSIIFQIKERHMYGLHKLGVLVQKEEITSQSMINDTGVFINVCGNKRYQMTNHLGNVICSISNKLVSNDLNNDGTTDYYKAEITYTTDYYPFGQTMVERTLAASIYPLNFNNKPMDVESHYQDYGFRLYYPLLCKFISTDPLTREYPWLTTYQFASNTPIQAIDLDGLEAFFVHGMNGGPHQWENKKMRNVGEHIWTSYTNNRSMDYSFSWREDKHGSKLHARSAKDRDIAADMLVAHIKDYRAKNGIVNEEITIIGFSSGGLVALRAARKLHKEGYKVNIILFNTPKSKIKNEEHPAGNPGINDLLVIDTEGDKLRELMPGKFESEFRSEDLDQRYQVAKIISKVQNSMAKHFVVNHDLDSFKNQEINRLDPVMEGPANNCGNPPPVTSEPVNSGPTLELK